MREIIKEEETKMTSKKIPEKWESIPNTGFEAGVVKDDGNYVVWVRIKGGGYEPHEVGFTREFDSHLGVAELIRRGIFQILWDESLTVSAKLLGMKRYK